MAGKRFNFASAGMPTALLGLVKRCLDIMPEARPTFADIVTEFDDVLIDCMVWDKKGRALWKKFYRGKSKVLLVKLRSALSEYVGEKPKEKELACLGSVLDPESSGYVTIQQFSNFLKWFGPLDEAMLMRLVKLLQQTWFHGDIGAAEAERRLSRTNRGTFLLRFSSGSPGNFSLSLRTKEGTKHLRITSHAKGYQVAGKVHSSLNELVKKTKELKHSCKGSKYAFVFSPCVSSGYMVVG